MSLSYLSGDEDMISGKKKSGKKPKGKKKKIAKIALAPARGAFLVCVSLNLLKLGKKLARVCKASGGKDRLVRWWTKIGGSEDKLIKAISKGAKESVGAQMGVAVEATIATATALIIAVAPIIKEFKAGGDEKEAKEFDDGIEKGKETLANDPPEGVEHGTGEVPEGEEVGLIKGKGKKGAAAAIPGGAAACAATGGDMNSFLLALVSVVVLYFVIRLGFELWEVRVPMIRSIKNLFSNGKTKVIG